MFRSILTACCVLMLVPQLTHLGAQPVRTDLMTEVRQATNLRSLSAAFRPPVPVRIDRIQAPRNVTIGEAFSAGVITNVGSATLPVEARWTFDDGTMLRGLSIRHTLETPGTHSVVVRVRNPAGEEIRRLRITAQEATSTEHTKARQGRSAPGQTHNITQPDRS